MGRGSNSSTAATLSTANKMLKTDLIPAERGGSRRLLLMLHGLGDSIEGFRWMPEALRLPWLNYLLVNAPDEYYGGYSWYDFANDSLPGVLRSRKLLSELLDAQRAAGWPDDQMILGGFSQGCLMALETGLRHPRRLAGIIGISGYLLDATLLVQELPPVALQQRVLVSQGTLDTMIPFAPVREQINELKAAGLKIEWHELAKGHTIAGETELEIIRNFIEQSFP
jgi:phospholipase/carboxylesterase